MIDPVASPYLVPSDGSFRVADAPTAPPKDAPSRKKCEKELKKVVKEIYELQRQLYADDRKSLLLIFQAMDAAGKDSTIRSVMSGVNPAGFQVYSFKQPSKEELDHDFLWRSARRLPERGRIGIYNRSYYEEVLVVRVHPEYLGGQRLPDYDSLEQLWEERYDSIRDHEKHLSRNGTAVMKFWLNVGRDEQKARFLSRIDEPHKNWKFSGGDVKERRLWPKYMEAYEGLLNATHTEHGPWYAIPADDKPFMRLTVAKLVRDRLASLGTKYPTLPDDEKAELGEWRKQLEAE